MRMRWMFTVVLWVRAKYITTTWVDQTFLFFNLSISSASFLLMVRHFRLCILAQLCQTQSLKTCFRWQQLSQSNPPNLAQIFKPAYLQNFRGMLSQDSVEISAELSVSFHNPAVQYPTGQVQQWSLSPWRYGLTQKSFCMLRQMTSSTSTRDQLLQDSQRRELELTTSVSVRDL